MLKKNLHFQKERKNAISHFWCNVLMAPRTSLKRSSSSKKNLVLSFKMQKFPLIPILSAFVPFQYIHFAWDCKCWALSCVWQFWCGKCNTKKTQIEKHHSICLRLYFFPFLYLSLFISSLQQRCYPLIRFKRPTKTKEDAIYGIKL